MGRRSGVYRFLGMIFILCLLIQGSYAAEESNETNTNLNYTVNDTLNGSIIGTINGTINDADNGTVIGTISGTLNGTVNGTISSTRSKIDPFQWVLILPILVGYLLFLSWMCRFFDKMNFCFVVFILFMLIVLLLRFIPSNLIPVSVQWISVIGLLGILVLAIKHEVFSKWKKGDESNTIKEGNPITCLHDIVRNFIVISAILIWPLILLYFYKYNIESVTFYGVEKLEFPVYIIAASTIGALSYLLLSLEETFGQLIPEYKKMSIAWSYVRRILIAPFIALIAVYILPFQNSTSYDPTTSCNFPTSFDPDDIIVIFVVSFFAGFYTKTVEKWVYLGVQKLLPADNKMELESRTEKYDVEKSYFIKKLGLDEDLTVMLYSTKIRTIEELAGCNAEDIRKKINLDTRNLGEGMGCPVKKRGERRGDYSIQQIQLAIDKAQEYMGIDKSELITILKMDKDLASKIYNFANIRTIEDLSTRNGKYICNRLKTCKEDVKEDVINGYINKAICYMVIKKSDLVTELKMPRELAFKIYYKANIDSIKQLKGKTAEEIHEDLAEEFKEDVTINEINEYKELAQKNFPNY